MWIEVDRDEIGLILDGLRGDDDGCGQHEPSMQLADQIEAQVPVNEVHSVFIANSTTANGIRITVGAVITVVVCLVVMYA